MLTRQSYSCDYSTMEHGASDRGFSRERWYRTQRKGKDEGGRVQVCVRIQRRFFLIVARGVVTDIL